jgi:signal transduction histidine kinase
MAVRLTPVPLFAVMGVVNIGLAIAIIGFWPGQTRWLAVSFFAYASFQLFSGLLMRYARKAELMSERLQLVNAELISTRSLLEQSARDSERLRLSRELHDVAGHALTALKLNLGALARDPRQPDIERVQTCATLSDELLQSLRGVVRQMREHEGIDLSQAIAQLAAPFPKPKIEVDIAADARVDDMRQAEALLRTVQEGLTNAVRHSGATRLWLRLRREASEMLLEIRDNGRGPIDIAPGNGLCGMRERLEELGGSLSIDRGGEGGVRLSARLPAARS